MMNSDKIQHSIFSPEKLSYKEKKYRLLYSLAHLYFITHNKSLPKLSYKDGRKAHEKLVKESWKHAKDVVKKHKDILKLIKK